jgi:hypothetical protein
MKVLNVNKRQGKIFYNKTSEGILLRHLALRNPKYAKSTKEQFLIIWHNYQIILIHHKAQGFTHVKLAELYDNEKLEINSEIDRSIEELNRISNTSDFYF